MNHNQKEVLFIDQSGSLFNFIEPVIKSKPDFEITYFNSKKNKAQNIVDFLAYNTKIAFGNLSITAERLNRSAISTIFIFNDLSPETQYLIKKINHSEVVYVEDGSAPYNDHHITRSWLKNILLGALFPFYEKINVLGTSSLITRSLFSFPEIVRSENKIKPASKLDIDFSKINQLKNFYVTQSKSKANTLILTPWKTSIENFLTQISRNDYLKESDISYKDAIIKSHPLQRDNETQEGIAKYVPAELIPIIHPNIKHVIGSRTTALQNIKILYPQINVYNISPLPKTTYDKNLETIGVRHIVQNKISGFSK